MGAIRQTKLAFVPPQRLWGHSGASDDVGPGPVLILIVTLSRPERSLASRCCDWPLPNRPGGIRPRLCGGLMDWIAIIGAGLMGDGLALVLAPGGQ